MKLKKAPFTRRTRKNLFLTFLLLLTLPLFLFALLQEKSFDFRNRAFNEIEVSEANPCVITFPNVNPYSLEINKTFRVQVDTLSSTVGIESININDNVGNTLLSQEYTDNPKEVAESFLFTPKAAIAYSITGQMVDSSGQIYSCVISSPYSVQGIRAIASNTKPIFKSTPKSSKPSQNIQVGTTYEYTIEAEDIDGDMINYSYSFTTNQTWLKSTVIDDGSGGRLTIKLKGSTDKPGSYLANIFIHDGYSQHLSSQSWVISVSPEGNDSPVITIIEPVTAMLIEEDIPLSISWEATDSNEIIRYEIYISSNPVNENTWISVDENVAPSRTAYSIDLKDIPDGTYRVIVRAIDNQTPPGIGLDISNEIIISRKESEETPDDQVLLPEPQIINVSPTSSDTVNNTTPTIKASLVSSEGTSINRDSIQMKLDNLDITNKIKINEISQSEYTVIYIPENSLEDGIHKVYISLEDSQGEKAEKEWTFTIGEEKDTESLYIFGLEIPKRTLYIILGGIGVILLAILIPILIVKIWKGDSQGSLQENPILPKTIPSESPIPTNIQETEVETLVKREKFEAPEPEISFDQKPVSEQQPVDNNNEVFEAPEPEILQTPETQTPTTTPPEPEQDLNSLYNQIKELEGNNGNNNSPS